MTEAPFPPPPPPHRVHLKHDEVMQAAIASKSRLRGSSTWFALLLLLSFCAAIWLGHLFTFWLVQQLPFPVMFTLGPYLPVVIPGFLCLIAAKISLDIDQRRATRAYLRSLAAIGAPLERDGVYEVTDEALVLSTERLVLAPRWSAIDTIERGEAGWVLSADQLHFLIPYADFPSVDAQRPLIAAITARMTAESRARSREAVEFASVAAEVRGDPDSDTAPPTFNPAPSENRDLPTAKGWLTQEQAGWAASVTYRKVARTGFHGWAYPLTGAVTGMMIGFLLVGVLGIFAPPDLIWRYPVLTICLAMLIPLACGARGLAYGNRRLGIVLDKAWRQGLVDRGVPEQIEAEWSLTETGLAYRTARFAGEAAYASIHQVLHEGGYWIVACDSLTLCIPDGAFASADDAVEFIGALLARIPEAARGRSVEVEPTAS